jgi:MFS family permease
MPSRPAPIEPAADDEPARLRRTSPFAVLAQRNFAPYFAGNLLSNCGTWFQNIAQALLVFRLTHSTFLVGVVNFAQFAGVILLAPWAGVAADRFDRRRLIIATQLGALAVTGTLAALAATGRATLTAVIGLALLLGLTTAFSTPALQAILPALVRREDLGAAVAMNSVTFNLARAVGPVVGALVVARLGIPWAIGLNSLSYAALVVAICLVRPASQPPRGTGPPPRIRDSLRLVRESPWLVLLLTTVAAVSFTIDPISTLTPAFATTVVHRADTTTGWLIGAFGSGAVAASLRPGQFGDQVDRVRCARQIALLLAVLVAGMAAFAAAPTLVLAYAALALAGAAYLSAQTRATTLLQLSVDDAQRGRVMALWSVAFLGSRPLASLVDGGAASLAGPRTAALLMCVPAAAAAVAMYEWARRDG